MDENGTAATQATVEDWRETMILFSSENALLGGQHSENTYAATIIEKYNPSALSTWHP